MQAIDQELNALSPFLNENHKMRNFIKQQMRSYKDADPDANRESGVSTMVLRATHDLAFAKREKSIAHLITSVHFFACISCECCTTKSKSKASPIFLSDVQILHSKTVVTETFRAQKSGEKFERASHYSTEDITLCPAKCFSFIVGFLSKERRSTSNVRVHNHEQGQHRDPILCTSALKTLRRSASFLGKEKLRHAPADTGNYSTRRGAALGTRVAKLAISAVALDGR